MARLETVSTEELEEALEEVTGKLETKRLLVAIIYKRGPSVPMIAEWLGMREQTIYDWFDRLEEEPVKQAVHDRARSGRPPKLDSSDREVFRETVRRPPTESGYDQTEWTTSLAQKLLLDEFDVDYSRRHVRRLLREAGHT